MTILGTESKSLRKAYGETLVELGIDNKNIVVLDADLSSSTQTKLFAEQFPSRFFNCGIAEQDMIATAAGLASQGKIPFVSTFAMFATGRTYDQIRNSVCYPKFNVKIVATHGGVTVGEDGASHQALEDVALMRNLPNMTVIVPADYKEVQEVIKYAATYNGPMYIRIPRTNLPDVFDNSYKFDLQPKEITKGTNLTIITNGETLKEILQAEEVLHNKGISVQVIHCPVVKPTTMNLLNMITSKTVYTVENHSIIGGLGSMVSELIAENASELMLTRLGVKDECGQSGTAKELLEHYELSANKIVDIIQSNPSELFLNKLSNLDISMINAVSSPEFAPVFNLIKEYESYQASYLKQYAVDDARCMFFTKVINTAYSYLMERTLIQGGVRTDMNIQNLLRKASLGKLISEDFLIYHNFYDSFIFYARLFSCIESSLRLFHEQLGYNNLNKFIPITTVVDDLINNCNIISNDYNNLFKLLSTVRNLMHCMGVSIKNESIPYKGKTYKFYQGKFVDANIVKLTDLLDLYKIDVIDFIEKLFNSDTVKKQNSIQDIFITDKQELANWMK